MTSEMFCTMQKFPTNNVDFQQTSLDPFYGSPVTEILFYSYHAHSTIERKSNCFERENLKQNSDIAITYAQRPYVFYLLVRFSNSHGTGAVFLRRCVNRIRKNPVFPKRYDRNVTKHTMWVH